MQPKTVDQYLLNYREYSARCDFLKQEIQELRFLVDSLHGTEIEDSVSITQSLSGMPHGTNISDPTGILAIKFADGFVPESILEIEAEIREKDNELRCKSVILVFVDAWLKVLNRRERFVIENKTIEGIFWRELVILYKHEFGEEYSRQGLKKIRDRALEKIYKIAE